MTLRIDKVNLKGESTSFKFIWIGSF